MDYAAQLLSNAASATTVLRKVKENLRRIFQRYQTKDRFGLIDAKLAPVEEAKFALKQENFDAEKTFFILFSYKDGSFEDGLPINSRLLHKKVNPPTTTLGFNQIFWKVFKRSYSIQLKNEHINWLGMNLILREAFILVTREGACVPNEPLDCLIIYCLESIDYLKDEVKERIQQEQRKGLSDKNLMDEFNIAIERSSYYQLSKIKPSDFPGYSLITESCSEGSENVFPFFYGFYCYGWLLFNRLERSQIDIDLNLKQYTSNQSLKHIVEHRIRLLNIQRYFFTLNRSKLQAAQKTADMLTGHFHLYSRYTRHTDIHKSFEEHLANVARLSETERTQVFKNIANILTFLGIPLAIFSALMSANLDAVIVVKPDSLWRNYKFSIIAAASFLVPSSLVFFGFFIDRIFEIVAIIRRKI
jgi:hypothetical protein